MSINTRTQPRLNSASQLRRPECAVSLGTYNATQLRAKIQSELADLGLLGEVFVVTDDDSKDSAAALLRALLRTLKEKNVLVENFRDSRGHGNLDLFGDSKRVTTLNQDDQYCRHLWQRRIEVLFANNSRTGMVFRDAKSIFPYGNFRPSPLKTWVREDIRCEISLSLPHLKNHAFPFSRFVMGNLMAARLEMRSFDSWRFESGAK